MEELIRHVLDYSPAYTASCFATALVPTLIRRVVKWSRASDDRAVSAHLHAVGPATRGGLLGSVGGLDRSRIEHALVRLCAKALVERSDDGEQPTFKIAEGAEVLIED